MTRKPKWPTHGNIDHITSGFQNDPTCQVQLSAPPLFSCFEVSSVPWGTIRDYAGNFTECFTGTEESFKVLDGVGANEPWTLSLIIFPSASVLAQGQAWHLSYQSSNTSWSTGALLPCHYCCHFSCRLFSSYSLKVIQYLSGIIY